MIEREKIDELGYLNVQRNRDKFLTNKFNKSKSTSTVDFCKGALHSFDNPKLVIKNLHFNASKVIA